MKKRHITLLLIVAAIACIFAACGDGAESQKPSAPTVKSISVTDFDADGYEVGDTIDYNSVKLVITYEDGGTDTKTVAQAKATIIERADLSVAGATHFTVKLGGATVKVDLTVKERRIEVESYEMPAFWTQYLSRSTTATGDAAFKKQSVAYEVGNVNKFTVEPRITAFDDNDDLITISSGVRTVPTVEVSDTAEGAYTALSGDALTSFVAIEGNSYKFSAAAAGKYVKLNIAIDKDAYVVGQSLVDNYTLSFKVVDGGYNVYDQAGMAVMTDLIKPEFWADILGVTVDNGAYVAGENPLTLDADDRPLYTYIGNVDWMILHGNITVTADKLPAKYFRSASDADYNTAKSSLDGAQYKENMLAQLEGSLNEGDGQGNPFITAKRELWSSNGNNGLYATSRANVSGNYNSIVIDGKTETGKRKIKTVVNKNMANPNMMISQWYLFKMFEDEAYSSTPSKTFTVKNIALKGTSGRTENARGVQGPAMINSFSNALEVENVVADSFYMNFAHDNFKSGVKFDNSITIEDCKINDTYNTMALSWRGNINVINSSLKNPGGPLFILDDGVGDDYDETTDNRAYPTLTYDENSELEAFANGTESWYTSLGSDSSNTPYATALFAKLQVVNNGLQQISGKSFFRARPGDTSGDRGYASVIGIVIPEANNAFMWPTEPAFEWRLTAGKINTPDDEYSMRDAYVKALYRTGTLILKSGANYAIVVPDGSSLTLMSPEMAQKYQSGAYGADYKTNAQYQADLAAWATAWRTTSTDTVCAWLQANANSYSPYLGVVFGGFETVTAA